MKKYHLFWNKDTAEPIVVKSGFSWLGFFFGAFYAAYLRAWKTMGLFLIGSLFITAITVFFGLDDVYSAILNLTYNVYIGFDFSDCVYGEFQTKKNLEYLGSDFATNKDHAEFLAFQKHATSLK